jgi:hypothetical protein
MMLTLFLLIGLYFFPILFQNQVFYYGDISSIFLPMRQFFFGQLHQGALALWNPNIYSGYPFFADITLSNYYLPAWLLYFNDSIKAVSWLIVLHFFAAAYFMYQLGRQLKFSSLAALFSAVIYTFSGIMVNYIADPQRFFVISLFPLFFCALFKGRIIFIALVLALQIFAGHIQYVFIEVLASLFFWRRLKVLVPAGILAGLFTAIGLLPMLEFIPYTTRPEAYQDLSIFQSFSLHPASVIRFALAHFWGIKNQGFRWGTLDTTTIGYIGFLPVLLIIWELKRLVKNKTARCFLLISGLALLVSLGTYLPFFKIFTIWIPLFRLFRNPMAWLSLYTFFAALLAGFAWDSFKFSDIYKRWAIGFGLAALAVAGLLLAVTVNSGLPHDWLLKAAAMLQRSLSVFHTAARDREIAGLILTNLLAVSVFAALAFGSKNKKAIIVISVIDLFIFTRSNLYTVDQSVFNPDNPVAGFLQQNLGGYRYLSSSEAVPYSGLNDFFGMLDTQSITRDGIRRRLVNELELQPPNFGMVNNLPTINGYTSLVDRRYLSLFSGRQELNPNYQKFLEYNPLLADRPEDLNLSKIDLAMINNNDLVYDKLAVKYFVTDRDIGLPADQRVFYSGEVSVYQNNGVRPRAVLLNEKEEIIEVPELTSLNPNHLAVKLQNKGKLVIYDTFYPGWTATVNDQPAKIQAYENIFRSVEVPENNTRVVFNFRPQSFYWGVWISGISFCLTLLLIVKYGHENFFR